jgi:site-specific recombinase XerD
VYGLFTCVGNRALGRRITPRFTVDGYLEWTQLKRPRVSDHALRHAAATLAYRYSHDLRAVQDLLGHSDPRTTARNARVARATPVLAVPVNSSAPSRGIHRVMFGVRSANGRLRARID